MSLPSSPEQEVLYFPDLLDKCLGEGRSADEEDENEVSNAFFELANAPLVGYRIIQSSADSKFSGHVVVRQNSSVQDHTGGIVWETSYLLANYLIGRYGRQKNGGKEQTSSLLGKVLEIGSGCGMLGLVLGASRLAKKVVLTETTEVMDDLVDNVKRNETNSNFGSVVARRLRWDELEADLQASKDDLQPHSFDTILGTDVVFSVSLVRPLLSSIAMMAHKRTQIYLCLQIRCADSHSLLLKKASKFGLRVDDCSESLRDMPSCSWGLDMECKLLRIVVKKSLDDSVIIKRGKKAGRC